MIPGDTALTRMPLASDLLAIPTVSVFDGRFLTPHGDVFARRARRAARDEYYDGPPPGPPCLATSDARPHASNERRSTWWRLSEPSAPIHISTLRWLLPVSRRCSPMSLTPPSATNRRARRAVTPHVSTAHVGPKRRRGPPGPGDCRPTTRGSGLRLFKIHAHGISTPAASPRDRVLRFLARPGNDQYLRMLLPVSGYRRIASGFCPGHTTHFPRAPWGGRNSLKVAFRGRSSWPRITGGIASAAPPNPGRAKPDARE